VTYAYSPGTFTISLHLHLEGLCCHPVLVLEGTPATTPCFPSITIKLQLSHNLMNVLLAQPSHTHILALEPALSLYNTHSPPEDTHSDTYRHRHNTPYLLIVAMSLVSRQSINIPSALKDKQSWWWLQELPPWSYFHCHKLVVLRLTRFQSTVLCRRLLPATSINCWRRPPIREFGIQPWSYQVVPAQLGPTRNTAFLGHKSCLHYRETGKRIVLVTLGSSCLSSPYAGFPRIDGCSACQDSCLQPFGETLC